MSLVTSARIMAVIDWPHLMRAQDFHPLQAATGVELRWVRSPTQLQGATWVVLPGSCVPASDLAWMRACGLDAGVVQHVRQGGAVLGLGSGAQMLGEALIDPQDLSGNAPGLGLLPLVAQLAPTGTAGLVCATFATVRGPWQALSGLSVQGEAIACGPTVAHPAMVAAGDLLHEVVPGLAWQDATGQVLGLYLHGLFDQDAVRQALLG